MDDTNNPKHPHFPLTVEVALNDNPYASPVSITIEPTPDSDHETVTRPVGVSILAVLHLVGGVLLLGAQFMLIANMQEMDESLRFAGIPPMLLIGGVMFLAILTIASGVGMRMGTKWGWWLAAFYYTYSVFRNGSALMTIISVADQLEGADRGPEYYMIKHGVRLIISLLLLMYFFKGNVLDFFGLARINKIKAIAILVGICVAIVIAKVAMSMAFA